MRAGFSFPSIGTTTYSTVPFRILFPFPTGIYVHVFLAMGVGGGFFLPHSMLGINPRHHCSQWELCHRAWSPSLVLQSFSYSPGSSPFSLLSYLSLEGLSQLSSCHLHPYLQCIAKAAVCPFLSTGRPSLSCLLKLAGLPAANSPSILSSWDFIPIQSLYIPEWHLESKGFRHVCSFLFAVSLESTR